MEVVTSASICRKVGPYVGESWGMAKDREWRTPHFQQKWKRGHNENSQWQLLFIHSLVVCSDLGDLPKFCSEISKKQVNGFSTFLYIDFD